MFGVVHLVHHWPDMSIWLYAILKAAEANFTDSVGNLSAFECVTSGSILTELSGFFRALEKERNHRRFVELTMLAISSGNPLSIEKYANRQNSRVWKDLAIRLVLINGSSDDILMWKVEIWFCNWPSFLFLLASFYDVVLQSMERPMTEWLFPGNIFMMLWLSSVDCQPAASWDTWQFWRFF